MDGCARVVEGVLVALNPAKNLDARWGVIRTGHGVAGRVPKIDAGHDLRGRESLHRFARVDGLVAVPGIVEEPGGFALCEGAKRRHANLI